MIIFDLMGKKAKNFSEKYIFTLHYATLLLASLILKFSSKLLKICMS